MVVLLARLAVLNHDADTVESALAELDRLDGSPVAAVLAQRVRALMLLPTRRRREATDALEGSANTLERLGFAGFAAETRLEWADHWGAARARAIARLLAENAVTVSRFGTGLTPQQTADIKEAQTGLAEQREEREREAPAPGETPAEEDAEE